MKVGWSAVVSSMLWLGFWTMMIQRSSAFSSPSKKQESVNGNTPLFERFIFAPNDVCVKPSIFYDCSSCGKKRRFRMRNVPGEGDCMFQAVALATSASMGLGGNNPLLKAIANETRNVVAQILSNPNGNLLVDNRRIVRARDLFHSAAKSENLSKEEYLNQLKQGKLQGGGPELTVLSNVLRRPISIYELDTNNIIDDQDNNDGMIPQQIPIQKVGTFGNYFKDLCQDIPNSAVLSPGLQSGAYSWHIHILVVDSGNNEKHACALLPEYILQ